MLRDGNGEVVQRAGAPGQPSGGRAARAAQAEFISAAGKARVVQVPRPYSVSCADGTEHFETHF